MSTLFLTEVTPNLMNFPPWQFVDYVGLLSSKQIGSYPSPQMAQQLPPLSRIGFSAYLRIPLLELREAPEESWQDELHHTPQFLEVVLKWCPRQRKACPCFQAPSRPRGLATRILNRLRFIEKDC